MSLNVIALMGRICHDLELQKTPTGVSVCKFTIACDRSYVKAGEERQTDFIDIVAWRGSAEFLCKYFRKGQLIAVNGSLQTHTYEDKEGKKRKAYEVVADNIHFAEGKKQEQPYTQQNENGLDVGNDGFTVIDDTGEDLPF